MGLQRYLKQAGYTGIIILSILKFCGASTRINKELTNFNKIKEDDEQHLLAGCKAWLKNADLYHWQATLLGPEDSPYEDGEFLMDIVLPKDYPYKPPTIKFVTPVYHCNVDQNGVICLDILKDQWTPALSIEKTLISIRSLLMDPNPKSPLRGDIARLYISDRDKYLKEARAFTKQFAVTEKSMARRQKRQQKRKEALEQNKAEEKKSKRRTTTSGSRRKTRRSTLQNRNA